MKILLERVGNTNIPTDHGGKTALHYAAENSELSVSLLNNSFLSTRLEYRS